MKGFKAALFLALFLAVQSTRGLASHPTVPAFLWSPHDYTGSHPGAKEIVRYSRISPEELAKSVLSEGSWSNLLCSAENRQDNVDIALVFVGRKIRTSDISLSARDPSLIDLLKLAFTESNVSLAFPYVSALNEENPLEASLVSGLTECSDLGQRFNRVAYTDSCSINRPDFIKLQGLDSLHEHFISKMESSSGLKTDLAVFCSGMAEQAGNSLSDGEILSELISALEQLGAKYSVLYASDPLRHGQRFPYPPLERFLLEGTDQNDSGSAVICDDVCKIKSSLLEGLFVGIVLLIILISGLCCMMGIDTPSRFETPEES